MEERNYRFGVGLLVVGAGALGLVLLLFFGTMPSFLADRYQITINFPEAPGVGRDTPVRKNGVQIGRVAEVKLLPSDEGVNLVLELDRDVQLLQGETCRIASGSFITGDAIVEFQTPTMSQLLTRFDGVGGGVKDGNLEEAERAFASNLMSEGDYLTGGIVAGDPLDLFVSMQGNFVSTLSAIEQASRRVDSLASSIEGALGGTGGQVNDVAGRFRQTIENFNETVDTIDRVARQFEDARIAEIIGTTAGRLPILFDEAERVMTQTRSTLQEFEVFANNLQTISADFDGIGEDTRQVVRNSNEVVRNANEVVKNLSQSVDNINDFTAPLAGQSEALARTFDNLDRSLADVRVFTERLNAGDGTLAKLIEDDELYYSLISTLQNVEQVTTRLQPIVNDVRIFTDKIARDPRQLGVRGALTNTPASAGLKY